MFRGLKGLAESMAIGDFQSPFSGDFLCFLLHSHTEHHLKERFQSPFSGDFLCFLKSLIHCITSSFFLSISIFRRFSLFHKVVESLSSANERFFQSPFSGDFLCFRLKQIGRKDESYFQSPFSGDFLCFAFKHNNIHTNSSCLSISIFRRFSLFHIHAFFYINSWHDFQSPFSGDFLCF